ncbi:hypothetical protein GCM10020256_31460 [Streptomyces thermocoprophilus]
MPRAAPRHQRRTARERARPVVRCDDGAVADVDDLAADVGRLGGEQETQGGLGGVRVRQPKQVHRPAAPDLLAEGAGETLQRLLGGDLMVVGGVRRGTQHDHPAARRDRPDDRVQGGVHLRQRLHIAYGGGVEDDGGGHRIGRGGHRAGRGGVRAGDGGARVEHGQAGAGEDLFQARQPLAARRQMQQPALEGRPFGRPADQSGGPGQPEPAGQETPRRGPRERQIAVGHAGRPPWSAPDGHCDASHGALHEERPYAYSGVRLPPVMLRHGGGGRPM